MSRGSSRATSARRRPFASCSRISGSSTTRPRRRRCRCCSERSRSNGASRRRRAACRIRTWPRWCGSGKTRPASRSTGPCDEGVAMPRFAANLTMLWPELDVLDRFRAAAQAGFRRVEILFVHELDPAAVERAVRELGLELVLFDPRPGDWGKGERGLLSLPGREAEFLETIRDAIAAAQRFGT